MRPVMAAAGAGPVMAARRTRSFVLFPRPAVLTLGERRGQVWGQEEQRGDRLIEDLWP